MRGCDAARRALRTSLYLYFLVLALTRERRLLGRAASVGIHCFEQSESASRLLAVGRILSSLWRTLRGWAPPSHPPIHRRSPSAVRASSCRRPAERTRRPAAARRPVAAADRV